MSTCTHIWTWLSAARSEAILARHPRIEETDLLLGLLAQGGPVARTLGAAGVGLRPPPALAAGSAQEDLSIRLSRFMESSRCRLLAGDGRKSPLAR